MPHREHEASPAVPGGTTPGTGAQSPADTVATHSAARAAATHNATGKATGQFESAMRRALTLAANGPVTGANPRVGCVLVDDSGTIVAEGWHRGVGTAHAEVDALTNLATGRAPGNAAGQAPGNTAATPGNPVNAAPGPGNGDAGASGSQDAPHNPARPDLAPGNPSPRTPSPGIPAGIAAGLTAVVTLEPCNHTGHTGPCSVALIEAGVSRVVFAESDPGPQSGGGSERLREAGIDVVSGVLRADVAEFMRPWLTATRLGRPFVTLKWASSLDGRAAAVDGSSQWITGTASRQLVHEERGRHDAIAVGTGTALADDPSLTARGEASEPAPHQPLPVVIGERPIPAGARLRSHPAGLVETSSRDLPAVLKMLFDRGIRTLYVEGGPTLATEFVRAGLVDEFSIYLGALLLGGDRTAIGDIGAASIGDARPLSITAVNQVGNDIHILARPVTPTPTTGRH